jgi:uncharacterized protein YybS (DUF2232 family)
VSLSTQSHEPRSNVPWAFVLALSLLSPLFYLSLFFAILAPLPLLYLHQGTNDTALGRRLALIATFLGILLISVIRGPWASTGFLVFAAFPAWILGESFLRRVKAERAVFYTMTGLLLVTGLLGLLFILSVNPGDLHELIKSAQDQVILFVDSVLKNQPSLSQESRDELKRILENPRLVLVELPGLFLGSILLLSALPAIAMIRWNPKGFLARTGYSRDTLRSFRTPDWLVWPALFSVALLIFEVPKATPIAQNLLKPLILIYFFQGMSILAFFLDSLRLRGTFRILLYGFALMFLTPMVVSFGFFDLWFDFRERVKENRKRNTP